MPSTKAVLEAISAKGITLLSPALTGDTLATKWLQSTRATFKCNTCDHTWETALDNISRKSKSSGCPNCAILARKVLFTERGRIQIEELAGSLGYTIVGGYHGHFERLDLRCHRGHSFKIAPVNLQKQRCPTCSGTFQHLDVENCLKAYIAGTTWQPINDLALLKCACCGETKTVTWLHMRTNRNVPVEQRHCICQRYGKKHRMVVDEAGGYELLEVYRGMKTPILHRHTACGTEWHCQPGNFIRGTRCPTCAKTGRTSSGQRQVTDFLKSIGVSVRENVTGLDPLIPRSEVDIFLPDHNVAVEFDGVWWHAEGPSRERAGKSRPSAMPDAIVSRLDRLAAMGIRLIRVFSDEWIHERATIESVLRSSVGLEEQSLDLQDDTLLLDRRLATVTHERSLAVAGYVVVDTLPPSCQYVHPSASNTRKHFDSDEAAIAAGYSRVWDSGYIVYNRSTQL
jgi:hypothetical protein